MPATLGLRTVVIILLGVAYVLGSHWLMTRAEPSPWNAVGVLTPMLAAITLSAWRGGQQVLAVLTALALTALCGSAWLGVKLSMQVLYLAQHVGVNLFLAIGFGSTLRAGHTALITTLASRVHRQFPPALAIYTRKVTIAWTLYFIMMAIISVALFAFASFDTWALFANLLTPLAVGLMFFAEYFLRYQLHPEFERSSMMDAIRSYRANTNARVSAKALARVPPDLSA